MILHLTAEQVAEIEPHLRSGYALMARIMREPFDGTNPATCGRWTVEFGPVPDELLTGWRKELRAHPELREIVRRKTPQPKLPMKTEP